MNNHVKTKIYCWIPKCSHACSDYLRTLRRQNYSYFI